MSPMVRLPLTIEYALLGFLRAGPRHGYQIYRQLRDPAGLGLVWRLKQSQMYALLARLEAGGQVAATLQPQATRPPRKVFQLTQTGLDTFLDWVERPVAHGREVRLHFLAKLYFAWREGPDVAARLIQGQRAACQGWLADHQARSAALPDPHSYEWLVCQFRIAQIKAMLTWLDACQHLISNNQIDD